MNQSTSFFDQNWRRAAADHQFTGVVLTTIDAHTAGEPLRILVGGLPEVQASSVLQYRQAFLEHHDDIRTRLMWEPRGHADMYGCIILPPNELGVDELVTDDEIEKTSGGSADFGVLFLHNEGYSSMCGHGIIAVVTAAAEVGIIEPEKTTVKIDAPAGRIVARPLWENQRVVGVEFDNVPSFVVTLDQEIEIPSIGPIKYDLAFGGAYYAYVDAQSLNIDINTDQIDKIVHLGREIKSAVAACAEIKHPIHDELSFLYGTIFVGPAEDHDVHSRNVCIFADGEVDRSPTGTGVSGRAAILVARGEIAIGESIQIESILGTRFDVTAMNSTQFCGVESVIPTVGGRAFLTGRHEFWIDERDPLSNGFLFR